MALIVVEAIAVGLVFAGLVSLGVLLVDHFLTKLEDSPW